MPWSPAKTMMGTRAARGFSVACRPASSIASCSSRPSAPVGFVSCACRAIAAARWAAETSGHFRLIHSGSMLPRLWPALENVAVHDPAVPLARRLAQRDDPRADLGDRAGQDDLIGHAEIGAPPDLKPF